MSHLIYKVVPRILWNQAEATGIFTGAPVDNVDGFIHFSADNQVRETVAKHFAGQSDLLIVAVDPECLGDALVWETSRGGDLFPHLFSSLSLTCVESVHELPLGDDGQHVFPDGI